MSTRTHAKENKQRRRIPVPREEEILFRTHHICCVDGRLSSMDLHYLSGTPEGTEHYVEHHELGLFTAEEMMRALTACGLEATYD